MGSTAFERQNLPAVSSMAEAIREASLEAWPSNTSGNLAHVGKISKEQAANVMKGHASGKLVAHLFRTVGMEFALRVIEITVGDSLDAHFARRAERAKSRALHFEATRDKLAESRRRRADMGDRLFDRLAR